MHRDFSIYLVAGEPSGDLLGAKLMMALKRQTRNAVQFAGLGGSHMHAQGLESLFSYRELSLMGFWEILPHIPRLKRRIAQVAEDILQKKPDVVVTIDSPGFNFRLVKQLRADSRSAGIKFVHYVAPTVWAYKPKRAAKIAPLFDKLLTLLPFEPPYFEREGLACEFVGHPVLEDDYSKADGAAFREKHGILPHDPILLLLPGSRPKEIRQHLAIFMHTLDLLTARFGHLTEVIVVPPGMRKEIEDHLAEWPGHPLVVSEPEEKHDAFAASTLALVKSGTVTLELACAEVPMVVTYRVSPVSAWLLRQMIKVKYVTLVNILLNKAVIPELLQERCQPDYLAHELAGMLINRDIGRKQKRQAHAALAMLLPENGKSPSELAAQSVLSLIDGAESCTEARQLARFV